MSYAYLDKNNVIKMMSDTKLVTDMNVVHIHSPAKIGQKIKFGGKPPLKVALVCNWMDECGISTYTKFLTDALAPKLDQLKILSENRNQTCDTSYDVEHCWERGKSMRACAQKILDWEPSVVLIQHEFGLFPKASTFLPFMEALSDIPVVVTLHSVYEHKDKSIFTSAIHNIIVHSGTAAQSLRKRHKGQNIDVIPHGCVDLGEVQENWNAFGSPYPIVQFGFGFSYKGVEVALEAISLLKNRNKDFNDIFYLYLCSESPHVKSVNNEYYNKIRSEIVRLGLTENASVQRGFYTEDELNQHLRTARLALFPYVSDPLHPVFGASGATRIAMANNVPTLVSDSHMFDDLGGVLPRPANAEELSQEIEKVFTDHTYRSSILDRQKKYIKENNWNVTADRYILSLQKAIQNSLKGVLLL